MAGQSRVRELSEIRAAEYPWAERATYMNAASFGAVPLRSLRAVEEFNRLRHEIDRFRPRHIVAALTKARSAVARLIGADPEEIALGPNTTWGINLAAGFLEQEALRGRRIVLSDREFPANVYPWMALERRDLRVDFVPTDARGRPREDALLERLASDDDIAAFSVSAVQFASGHRADLERLGRVCRERGILFVVDGIQGVGAVPLDVREAHVDVLACGGHKWLCSPFGTGFAYVRRELCERFEPREPGWMAFESSTDFSRLLEYEYAFVPDARRFDLGTMGFQDFAGLAESVELLLEIGVERVWDHIRAVQEPLIEWARERDDVAIVSDLDPARRSGILSVQPPDAKSVHAALLEAGVVCVPREGAIRLAPHFYNTVEEMERVVEILERTLT